MAKKKTVKKKAVKPSKKKRPSYGRSKKASNDFTNRTKILKGIETFDTVVNKRYYDLNDLDGDGSETDQRHILEVNKVDYNNYTIQRLVTPPDEVDIT